jgi:nucleoside-diphosphate-sugar epimerase
MVVLLSLGHGYSAQVIGSAVLARGGRVIGTTRSAHRAEALLAAGVEPFIWPDDPGKTFGEALAQATHILCSAAPDEAGDPFLAVAGKQIAASGAGWVGYLSTTGVYGDHDGAWVDETTPVSPGSARAVQRVLAERQWQTTGLPVHIFRLAGIYGPGRGPFEKVRDGTARRILKPGQVFSRIHVEDIAQAVMASMDHPNPGAVYNVCDNDPAPPEDVLSLAAALLGLPEPPGVAYGDAEMTPMARSFYAETKRVRNDRLKRDLRVVLRYPTYREGLAAILAAV